LGDAVALEAHQHFLLHGGLILALELLQHRLIPVHRLATAQTPDSKHIPIDMGLESTQIGDELVLFLHDAAVVHAMVVALLTKFIPHSTCFSAHIKR
jgi:hypothetical protein